MITLENEEVHIAVANNKGGAAKTLTVINLAQAFTNEGKRVVVIDGDKNRTCKNWAIRRGSQEPFPVITIMESFKYSKPKDIVLYDTAGGIADDEIKDLIKACEYLVVPCKADVPNMEASENMAKFFLENNINFRILISDAMSAGNFARARMLFNYFQEQGIPTFKQIIPRSAKMVDAGDQGKTIGDISGARFIADKFTEVALQILEDVANKQSSSLKGKDINQMNKDTDNSKRQVEKIGA